MADDRTTTGLDTLVPDILLAIARALTPPRIRTAVQDDDDMVPELEMRNPTADVVNLSCTSRAIRQTLAPVVFRALTVGSKAGPSKVKFQSELEWLATKDKEVLQHVRHFRLELIEKEALPALVKCMRNMDSLQFFSHAAPHPPFTAIIDFLNAQSSLVGIQAQVFADEVFRLLRPRPLQIIAMDATPGLVHKSMFHYLDVAPINVDVARRAPTKFATVPAPVARQTALVEGLAPLLVASASSLKVFDFDDESDSVRDLLPRLFSEIRLRGQAPIFPALTRLTLGGLALNGRDFKNLLITSTELTHLVIRDQTKTALEPPESGLSKLVLFDYEVDSKKIKMTSFARGVMRLAPKLEKIVLHGIRARDLASVWTTSSFASSSSSLKRVMLWIDGPVDKKGLSSFASAVSNISHLALFARDQEFGIAWNLLIAILARKLTKLKTFITNHTMIQRYGVMFPTSDGRLIRSQDCQGRNDFRIISVMQAGKTIGREMADRIRSDVEAATPFYRTEMQKVFDAIPTLRFVDWHPTKEVRWEWEIAQRGTPAQFLIQIPTIMFEATGMQNTPIDQPGIMMQQLMA